MTTRLGYERQYLKGLCVKSLEKRYLVVCEKRSFDFIATAKIPHPLGKNTPCRF